MIEWKEIESRSIILSDIPILSSLGFEQQVFKEMGSGNNLIVSYFAHQDSGAFFRFFIILRNLSTGSLKATSFLSGKDVVSLTSRIPSMMVFEREIWELHGINFEGNPWLKPLRYPFNRFDPSQSIDKYPFFDIPNPYLHQVQVGPVHAGIIESGSFRFICEGEKIHHLEISLGYHHRGVSNQLCNTSSRLRQVCIAETIAGDTTIGHAIALCEILENGWSNSIISSERVVALELERIAMHIADTGALAMDAAYQLGHVACEALRTLVINSMQHWCGNRFGRSLIRPFGTNFRLNLDLIDLIKTNISHVGDRYKVVVENLLSNPDFLARVDEICNVDAQVAFIQGAVGISGSGGDILNRIKLRASQVHKSCQVINDELKKLSSVWFEKTLEPNYDRLLEPNSLSVSIVKGWRGLITHVSISNAMGELSEYKIQDPSMRNWLMLALSVRGSEISDFPLSNKSYNLSYCGNDL